MRLDSLHLTAYGAFTDARLEFPSGAGMHIIYGDNEAGKSTALRSLSDLLFGFPHLTTADFRHEQKALRVGARLTSGRGDTLDITRRKGRGLTLRDAAGTDLDDGVLIPFIGRATRDFFETMFGLDHDRLRRGGQNLLEDKGDAGMGLFEAGTGIVNLRDALRALDTEIDGLFKPRGGKPLINAAIEAHSEARKEEKRARLSGETWKDAHRRYEALESEMSSVRGAIREKQTLQSRLQRLQRSLPLLARRVALLDESQVLVGVPDLPEDAPSQRVEAQKQLQGTREACVIAQREIARLINEREGLTAAPDLLAAESEIAQLVDDRGATVKADKDRPNRNAELRQESQQISRLLAALGWQIEPENAKSRVPSQVHVNSVRRLLNQHATLTARLEAVEKNLKESERQLTRHQHDLAALRAAQDVSGLAHAVRAAQAEGAVEDRGRQKKVEYERINATVSTELKGLRMFNGTLDELATLPVPLEASVERFTADFNAVRAEVKRLEERLREAADEVGRIDGDLARLNAESQVPTRAVLDEARSQREHGWRLVRRAYIDGRDDVGAEATAYDGERSLPEAYEHHVTESDRIADQMQAEAKRVADQAMLMVSREQAKGKQAREQQALEEAQGQLAALQAEWCEVWRPCALDPLSPVEMAAWLRQRAALLQRHEGVVANGVELEQLRKQVKALSERLSKALEAVGEPPATSDERLTALVERASARVQAEDEMRRTRTNLEKRIGEQNEKVIENGQQRQAVADERAQWEAQWREAIVRIGLDAAATPKEVEESLNVVGELDKRVDSFDELRHRVKRIDEDRAAFEGRVRNMVARVAPDLCDRSEIDAVSALNQRLDVAKQVDARLKTIADEQVRHERALETKTLEQARHEGVLERLCQHAGCESAELLEPIEKSAARKRKVSEDLANVEETLLRGGAGLSLEQLVKEAEGVNIDTLSADLTDVETALKELETKRERLAQDKGLVQAEIEAMNGGDEAAHHQQRAEQSLTRIKEGAHRYVRLVAAKLQLQGAIERHRARSQGPLVELASGFFRRLTGEAFSGLEVDYDDSERRVLLGKRASGGGVGVEGMSTGTRDQLFLSLRLAAIAHYIEGSESLPVIADDLLTDFDDERASQALGLLSEISAKVQVIFFTHHNHLLRLAEGCLDASKVSVHRL